jgi:hypothetical protein
VAGPGDAAPDGAVGAGGEAGAAPSDTAAPEDVAPADVRVVDMGPVVDVAMSGTGGRSTRAPARSPRTRRAAGCMAPTRAAPLRRPIWFRSTSTARADLVCYGVDYFMRLDNNLIQFVRMRPAGSSFQFVVASGTVASASDGSWHHATGVADAAGTRMWVDGRRVDADATALPFTYTAGSSFTVGRSTAGKQPFEGSLDDVRVYNRALTDSEIKALALGAD